MSPPDDPYRGVVDALAARVDALTHNFVTHGSVPRERAIKLWFADRTVVSFRMRPAEREELAPLLARLTPAPVGKGRETVVDPAVRQALSAKAAGLFTVEGVELGEVLAQVAAQLTPDAAALPSAELLDVHVYGPGGHFEPHKDTPRGPDMLGTLVICLPSRFRGGELRVGEGDEAEQIDWGAALRADGGAQRMHWAAFFPDVDHAIAPITAGMRVTLTYVLRRAPAAIAAVTAAPGPSEARVTALTSELGRAAQALAGPLTLVFPCRHLYADSALTQGAAALRGRDREVVRAALAAGLPVRVRPYLAAGSDDAAFYPLARPPAPDELEALPAELTPDELDALGPDDTAAPLPVPVTHWHRRHVATRAYSETGYFGNEGAELDFYRCAAVEVDIARRDAARGRRVRHAKFGAGEVLRSEPRETDVLLQVAFDDGTTRTLLGRFLVDA